MSTDNVTDINKHQRLTDEEREQLAQQVIRLYIGDQHSIRHIAEQTGRSYGAIHRLLSDASVPLRPRGAHTRTTAA